MTDGEDTGAQPALHRRTKKMRQSAPDIAGNPAAINQEAANRARSADQRAAGVAAVASLAASFALAGAALVLDKDKLREPFFVRPAFGIVLCIAVAAFIVAAVMAAITHTSQHDDAVDESKSSQNWAAARRKHTHMTRSLWALAVGMFFVLVLSGISILAPPP